MMASECKDGIVHFKGFKYIRVGRKDLGGGGILEDTENPPKLDERYEVKNRGWGKGSPRA